MKKGKNAYQKKVRVPLLWSVCSAVALIPLCPLIFFFILRKSGASFPIAAGQSTDPFFFGGIFAIAIPIIIYVFVGKVLRGIVMKRSSADIAKDMATDIAKTAVVMAAEVVLGGSSSDNQSSSGSGGTKGGGGESGGGGASGGY